MGKFDGFLICSDVDGTFRSGGDAEKVNSEAVRYFTENGGRFTFATGRMIGNLRESGIADIANAPLCLCNGGIIFDNDKSLNVFECHNEFTVKEFCDIIKGYDDITLYIFKSADNESSFNINIADIPYQSEELLNSYPIKIVCVFKDPGKADEFKEFALNNPFFKNTAITKSWPVGVEFNSIHSTKGTAIRFIKEYLGNIHTSIGIGDYENDIPMIRSADIGVAVGNALECVKNEADIIVKPAWEYALKDLINIIESKLLK